MTNISCRLGSHDCIPTGEYVEVTLADGPYGRRFRLYPLEKCVRCGKVTRDEMAGPLIRGELKQ